MVYNLIDNLRINLINQNYQAITSVAIQDGDFILSQNQRNYFLNGVLYHTLNNMIANGTDPSGINPFSILEESLAYFPIIVSTIIKKFITDQKVIVTDQMFETITQRVSDTAIYYQNWVIDRARNNLHDFYFETEVNHYFYGSETKTDIIHSIAREFIPVFVSDRVEKLTELKTGMSVENFLLEKQLYKSDNSEVWSVKRGSNTYAMKFEPNNLDPKFMTKFLKKGEFGPIKEELNNTDLENQKYKLLSGFKHKPRMKIGYFEPLNMKVKMMNLLEGPITKIPVDNKLDFLNEMKQILRDLHSSKYVFTTLSPDNIMVFPSTKKYCLIDLKNVTYFKGKNPDFKNDYKSLSLITSSTIPVTTYDDIESLLYIFDELISSKKEYLNTDDEITKKSNLSVYTGIVAKAIEILRELKQGDRIVNTFDINYNHEDYINEFYTNIDMIFNQIANSYLPFEPIITSLIAPDSALLTLIKNKILNSSNHTFINIVRNQPSQFIDQICMAILNYQVYGATSSEFREYINAYLISN